MMLAELATTASEGGAPLISFDTWGLIITGIVITVLWLAFRRMFPEEKKAPQK